MIDTEKVWGVNEHKTLSEEQTLQNTTGREENINNERKHNRRPSKTSIVMHST